MVHHSDASEEEEPSEEEEGELFPGVPQQPQRGPEEPVAVAVAELAAPPVQLPRKEEAAAVQQLPEEEHRASESSCAEQEDLAEDGLDALLGAAALAHQHSVPQGAAAGMHPLFGCRMA